MEVLHINQSDIAGGAAIAGYRLHEGLTAQGVSSRLMVGTVKTGNRDVAPIPYNRWSHRLARNVTTRLGLTALDTVGSFSISTHQFYQQADVLNFHNLHSSNFNYLAIPHLTKLKPAVFTLHDMWSFTGHCAYSYDCDRWKTGCGQCPYPETYPPIKRDSTRLEITLKKWIYDRARLSIVAPSRWLYEQAKDSILKTFSIHHIPNCVDTDVYLPLCKSLCRETLGIPEGKRVVMFSATSQKEHRKGFDLLVEALQCIPQSLKSEVVLLTFGYGADNLSNEVDIKHVDLGYVSSDRLKAVAYSSADVFVLPARADNLPVVLQESMACGTPMVACNVGGIPDLVRHNITGYVANPEDSKDLAIGITTLITDKEGRSKMSRECRRTAIEEYSYEVISKKYLNLYKSIVSY